MSSPLTSEQLLQAKKIAIDCAEAASTMRLGAICLAAGLARDGNMGRFVQHMSLLASRIGNSLAELPKIDLTEITDVVGIAMEKRGKVHKIGSVAASTAHALASDLARFYLCTYNLEFACYIHCVPKPTPTQTRRLCKRIVERFRQLPEWSRDEVNAHIENEYYNAVSEIERRAKAKAPPASDDRLTVKTALSPSHGGGQGGETESPTPDETVTRRQRVWRSIWSTGLAMYRVTIEAGWSALLEKLSGR